MQGQKTKGRPKQFAGQILSVRISALTQIRLHAKAQESGKTISDLVRADLERTYGK